MGKEDSANLVTQPKNLKIKKQKFEQKKVREPAVFGVFGWASGHRPLSGEGGAQPAMWRGKPRLLREAAMPLCGTGRVQRALLQAREPSLSPSGLWEGPWRLWTPCSWSGELCPSQPSGGAPTRPDSERRPGCELGAMGKLWGSRGGVSGGPWPERQGGWDWQASACGSGGWARVGIRGLGAFFLT